MAGNGTRTHCEDVAQDSADAGGCALKRFDVGGMIVGFDLVGHGQAIADVDDSGIFAGTLQYSRSFCRKPFQVDARTLVAAVLAPHDAEYSQFGKRGFAFQDVLDPLVFGFADAVL